MSTPDFKSPWHYRHLQKEYFAPIFRNCKQNGVWPLVRFYTGKQGEPYARKTSGRDVNPHWMVEDAAGNFRTDRRGYSVEDRWELNNVHTWDANDIAGRFDIDNS